MRLFIIIFCFTVICYSAKAELIAKDSGNTIAEEPVSVRNGVKYPRQEIYKKDILAYPIKLEMMEGDPPVYPQAPVKIDAEEGAGAD